VDLVYEHNEGAMQVLHRGGQAVARGSFLLQVLNRGAQAGAQTVAYGHATLSQQENNTRQMRRIIK
jgi:hypothetical protein